MRLLRKAIPGWLTSQRSLMSQTFLQAFLPAS